jgi:hypothetical protein
MRFIKFTDEHDELPAAGISTSGRGGQAPRAVMPKSPSGMLSI